MNEQLDAYDMLVQLVPLCKDTNNLVAEIFATHSTLHYAPVEYAPYYA